MNAHNSPTRKYGGTGLGLAFSRGYAKLLGGSIALPSTPCKGSEFIRRIPYQVPVFER